MKQKFVQFVALLLLFAVFFTFPVFAETGDENDGVFNGSEESVVDSEGDHIGDEPIVPDDVDLDGAGSEDDVVETVPDESDNELTEGSDAEAAEQTDEDLIRVGLYYGSSTLAGANLQNYTGAGVGFRFGYMIDGSFYQIGYTPETAISMVKAQNVYYCNPLPEGGYGYTDQTTSEIGVGCYHLKIGGSYETFEQAYAAAISVGGFPAWVDGEYQVRMGAYILRDDAVAAMENRTDATLVGTSSGGITVVITGTNTPVFQYDGMASGCAELTVKPGMDDSVKAITHFKGYRYYGSFCYSRNGGNLTVVNAVPIDDYTNCVISREMSESWPLEALKAQAVAARSYAKTRTGHISAGFDVCSTTCCQAYYGMNRTGANTTLASEETAGQYVWYNGSIAQAVYHSCDGGATENCENVWYEALPYLRGVVDPYEVLVEDKISSYHWTKIYTGADLQYRLSLYNMVSGKIVDVRMETTATGNALSVTLTDEYGEIFTLKKDRVRTVLGMSSLHFSIEGDTGDFTLADGTAIGGREQIWVMDGDGNMVAVTLSSVYAITANGVEIVGNSETTSSGSGTFVFVGSGRGHNLGMSQWGAYAMALEGCSYQDILHFYYTGIEIY